MHNTIDKNDLKAEDRQTLFSLPHITAICPALASLELHPVCKNEIPSHLLEGYVLEILAESLRE